MKVSVANLQDSGFYEASQAINPRVLGYENNYSQNNADQCREVYLHYFKLFRQIEFALKMGVTEITLRTSTGVVAIPMLDQSVALGVGNDLFEMLGDKMSELQTSILDFEKEAIQEEKDRLGESDRAKAFAHFMPMRQLTDEEFNDMPAEAQRAYNHYGDNARLTDEEVARQSKGGLAA